MSNWTRPKPNDKRVLTFEQWSTINRALCGARLELQGNTVRTKLERLDALSNALDALNDFTVIEEIKK